MKALVESPRRESIRCSSWEVPSVAVTSTWVSPRVKMADPWVRGSTRIWQSMGRMAVRPRPATRRLRELAQTLLAELLLLEGQLRLAPLGGHPLLNIEDGGKGPVREKDRGGELLLGGPGGHS